MKRLLAGLALAVSVAACDGAVTTASASIRPTSPAADVATPLPRGAFGIPTSDGAGFDALQRGRLEWDPLLDGGCFWLQTEGGPRSLVWPPGYSGRSDGGLRVVDAAGRTVARAL